ncbi:MAG: hypothetical protein WA005_03535 [Candidatus Binataceae bacterium]
MTSEKTQGKFTAWASRLALLLIASAGLTVSTAGWLHAEGPAASTGDPRPMIQLWEDTATHQVFTVRCKRCRLITSAELAPALEPAVEPTVEKKAAQIEQQVEEKTQADIAAQMTKLQTANAAMASQIQEMQPAWREFGERWFKKISIGTLAYADYGLYTHSTFGPQFMTQINQPGPNNSIYNSFDVTRSYINFLFTPTQDFTMRFTPNLYRAFGATTNTAVGKNSAVGSNLSQEMGIRVKYLYLDWNTPFKWSDPLKEDKLTFGQQPNPLVDWEENLYGFRYTSLTPWNYLSLSSTELGLAAKGPIKFNELQYADYDIGVYNNANFHSYEETDTKEVMGRLSLYPMGAKSRFQGLGITGFYNYGYSNNTPDVTQGTSKSEHLYRLATLLHYTAETWGLGGEFDLGHNAFTGNNLFSGSGPADYFGTATTPTPYATTATLAKLFQNDGQSQQLGYDFFGHVQIPNTPFTLFGLYEQLYANTRADVNPFDFERFVVGIEYKYNKYLRFALDNQNLLYYHSQFTVTPAQLKVFDPSVAAANPKGIQNAVLRDMHTFFLHVEFNY